MKTLLVILLCTLVARTCCQTDPDEADGSIPSESDAVSLALPERGAAEDSLVRVLARLEIARAAERVSSTGLLWRLIPRIQLTATYGVREVMFPETSGALILPRDSYRLTVSLSLGDVLDGSRHTLAQLELERATTRYGVLLARQAHVVRAAERRRTALQADITRLRQELQIALLVVRYQEYQFQQGKVDFPALGRARLEEIRLRDRILRLEEELNEVSKVGR